MEKDAKEYIPTERDSKILAKFKQQTGQTSKQISLLPSKSSQNALQNAIKNILYHNRHLYVKDLPADFFDADELEPNTVIADDSKQPNSVGEHDSSDEAIPSDFYDTTAPAPSSTNTTTTSSLGIFKRTPNVQLLLQNEMESDLQDLVKEIEKDNPHTSLTEEELAEREEMEEQHEQEYLKQKIAYFKNALLQKQSTISKNETTKQNSGVSDDDDASDEEDISALHSWRAAEHPSSPQIYPSINAEPDQIHNKITLKTILWDKGIPYYMDLLFQKIFYWIGYTVATVPLIVCALSIFVTLICATGIYFIQIETNPQKLWVPDDAKAVIEKTYFDAAFGPFFRIEQIIITRKENDTMSGDDTDVLGKQNALKKDILLELFAIQQEIAQIQVPAVNNTYLTLQDLCYSPIPMKGCLIQSPLEFWQTNYDSLVADDNVQQKVYRCTHTDSLKDECRSSLGIPIVYKQVMGSSIFSENSTTAEAKALLVTYLLNNNDTVEYAKLWEAKFIEIRSVEDELYKETSGDVKIIIISYVAMFIYVAVSLGQVHPIKSKIALAFAGILIVIMSIFISAGLCSYFQVKATLIISEVIPFLILAIGVDNMFILASHLELSDPSQSVPERIGHTLSQVGTSMALASISEFLAFMLGSLTRMPAVQAFTLYAGVAIIANFILQITCFTALLSIDLRRVIGNRLELEPFLKVPQLKRDWFSVSKIIRWFLEKVYAPVLLFPVVRALAIFFFFALAGVALFFAQNLEMGLDQVTALPSSSYLIPYFYKQRQYLDLGPPVYFVTKNLNYSDPAIQTQLFDAFDKVTRTPYIDRSTLFFWLENFKKWLYVKGDSTRGCTSHVLPITQRDIPPEMFIPWLQEFLGQTECCVVNGNPTPLCGFQFRGDVQIENNQIVAARIMAQTKTLITQSDFINSIKAAYYTGDVSPVEVFPYSVYYIYFAQYLYLPEVAASNIVVASIAVLLTTLFLLASPVGSCYILLCICLIDIDLLGIMSLFGIYVNAISVVNLVMSIGISVEFCVHITKAFISAKGTHEQRTKQALASMGTNVLSGITFTKMIGVTVLNFSQSEIFRIYYFKMYFSIVILGALHGIVFLPALLSFFGPTASSVDEQEKVETPQEK